MAQETLVITIIGFVAGFFTSIGSLPQIIKVLKTKHVDDLSMQTMALFCIGAVFWLTYGIYLLSWPVIVVNVFFLLEQGLLFFLKSKYGTKKH